MIRSLRRAILALVVLAVTGGPASPAAGQLRDPLHVARVLVSRYPAAVGSISYIPALTWFGSLRLADATADPAAAERALARLRPFIRGEAPAIAEPYRLTNLAGLAVLVDLPGPDSLRALDLAVQGAELVLPDDPDDVVDHATGWTDDMFMAAWLLGRVGARTGDARYARAASRMLLHYADRLQRDDGLFVHAETGPVAWGRGNGFAAFGLVEALDAFGETLPERGRILEIYRRQMAALRARQAEDGSWHQVVDVPTSYRELTVTAMSLRTMARGVRRGWLDRDDYRPVIDRAWEAVLARVDADGRVRDACASTAAGTTLEYYLDRPAVDGLDDRAGGLVLLAALELDALRGGAR